jgi:16S rRNA G1207 methylase RsmC
MADKDIDPALRLLEAAPVERGERALLILAGAGGLAAAYAPHFGEIICHNAYHPQHAAALAAMKDPGLGNVRCVLGDLPCAERPAGTGSESGPETFLSDVRFPPGHFDLIAFRLGRGTAQVNAALMESFRLLKPGGCLMVAGHNQEGIKSFAKRGEAHFGSIQLLKVKSSCRLLLFRKETESPGEGVEEPRYFHPVTLELEFSGGGKLEYLTKPGIFAYRSTDPGTALFARHLPSCEGKSVLDLGCGSGALSLAAFKLGAKAVLATDSSAIATACAARNFALQNMPGKTLCTDLAAGAEGGFDLILTNPPFHKDGDTDYSLPGRILDTLSRLLNPQGVAYLVANQFLDYSNQARKLFPESGIIARDQGYTVHRMVKAG